MLVRPSTELVPKSVYHRVEGCLHLRIRAAAPSGHFSACCRSRLSSFRAPKCLLLTYSTKRSRCSLYCPGVRLALWGLPVASLQYLATGSQVNGGGPNQSNSQPPSEDEQKRRRTIFLLEDSSTKAQHNGWPAKGPRTRSTGRSEKTEPRTLCDHGHYSFVRLF